MDPQAASIPESLIEALKTFRCPKSYKELLVTMIRLSGTYEKTHREVSYSYLSKFMNKEKYRIKKCLNSLFECRMILKTTDPRFPNALCLTLNTNYSEWTYSKSPQYDLLLQSPKPQTPDPELRTSDIGPWTSDPEPAKFHPCRKRPEKKSKTHKKFHPHHEPESSKDVVKNHFHRQFAPPVLCIILKLPLELPISIQSVRSGKSPPSILPLNPAKPGHIAAPQLSFLVRDRACAKNNEPFQGLLCA